MGALRELQLHGIDYTLRSFDDLLHSVAVPKDIIGSVDKFILALDAKANYYGETVHVNFASDFPYAYARNEREAFTVARAANELDFLELPISLTLPASQIGLRLKGYQRISDLKKGETNAKQVFVAMWFNPSMTSIWQDGFLAALEKDLNLSAVRVDKEEFNHKIDDEIIARIRQSRLLVADLTGHRLGVYFEAGFAMGLGTDVIWTCKKEELTQMHFDIRQYNCIDWTTADELRIRLKNRIEATHPELLFRSDQGKIWMR